MAEIDFVVPMVFPQDKEWQREYERCCGSVKTVQGNVRYRSWGTEELLIRCVMKYMPWVRRIYVLLASESQIQPWMLRYGITAPHGNGITRRDGCTGKDGPELRLVLHREFIPSEHLPCFSSPCIEMFLHRLPGLSEQFVYANDDMFPLSPLKEDDFFRDGKPCQELAEKPFPSRPNIFHRACIDGLNMIAAPFGKHYTGTFLRNGHSFAPYLKSVCEEVWRRHGEQILKHLSPLRRKADSYNQYLYAYYQHLAGIAVAHAPRRQYVGPGTSVENLANIIRDPEAGIVCLNDNERIKDWEQRAEMTRREMDAKLGVQDGGIDVVIIHYNTQELTEAAILSLWKHTPRARVTVFDNSDTRPFCQDGLKGHVSVIDNTRGQVVDWKKWLSQFPDKIPTPNDWGSAKHCYSVEMCLDRFPEGFVLMDSDVLVKRDVTELADRTVAWKGGVQRPKTAVIRIEPYLCWINTAMLKEHGVRYFNGAKMWSLTSRIPGRRYDTGAYFMEACSNAGLPGTEVDIGEFVEHYGHASWRAHTDPALWLREHRELWREQKDNVRIFVCTHTDFKPVVHNRAYEVVDARQHNGDRCENGLRGSFYSELISYRHIAERDDLPEYVGFCAYRKYFSFMDDVPDMDDIFRRYDAVAATPVVVRPNVREQYAQCHNVRDLDIVSDIIRRGHPRLWPSFRDSLSQHTLYACNMFIVRRDDFQWLVKTLFAILDQYLSVVGLDIDGRIAKNRDAYHIGQSRNSTPQYQYRIGGFLGERIVNALLRYRFKRIMCYDKVVTQKRAAALD